MHSNSAILWIVATPIGNTDDFSPRARDVLAEADIILAEDTRRAQRIFQNWGIKPASVLSFYEHNEEQRQAEVIKALKSGAKVALITDAGTPLLADPGYRLVRACRQAGIRVSPVPGPNAPVTALCASGIAPIPFTFLGFLPRSGHGREKIFEAFSICPGSLIFFERKDRLCESLEIAFNILGQREVAICRELTKTHEQFILGHLKEYEKLCSNILGELTVIIGPGQERNKTPDEVVRQLVDEEMKNAVKGKEVARKVYKKVIGWKVSEIYALIYNSRYN